MTLEAKRMILLVFGHMTTRSFTLQFSRVKEKIYSHIHSLVTGAQPSPPSPTPPHPACSFVADDSIAIIALCRRRHRCSPHRFHLAVVNFTSSSVRCRRCHCRRRPPPLQHCLCLAVDVVACG